LKEKSQIFKDPLATGVSLDIVENKYFYTRGGWVAKIIYVNNITGKCFAVHNPGTAYEIAPITHDINTGFAMPMFSLLDPPAYTGHPSDLVREMSVS
jgi:hypothetical protein